MTKLRNSLRWRAIARGLLFVGAVGAFLTSGDFAANYLIETQRQRQLEELGGIALRSSETVVDYGIAALRGVAQSGTVGCDSGALQSLRLHLYRSGVMKDIRVVRPDGTVLCSAFAETLEFDNGWATRDDMLLAIGGAVRLFRVEQFFGTALGAMIDVDTEHSLAGIMAVDGSLFDVIPAELRVESVVSLRLANGQMIASTASSAAFDTNQPAYVLTVPSYRYPLQTVIRIERSAFEAWNRQPYLPIMALSGLLGMVFGALLARGLFRSRSPLEELDRAIAQGQIRPYFQPIFELRTGAITGAEMLARWVKPDGTVIPPARFIELAEESARIQALTWQLLSTALMEIQQLLKADENFHVSINISPSHFATDGFVQQLRDTVSAAGVAPRQITLELTERENFDDPDLAAAIVAEVRSHGFKVAIDDVGIGHSGLSQIQRLRADILKVDKFFIDSVNLDPAAAAMIAMLVRLAREMNMSIIAEGIENRQQVDALIACGIANGQGYVVSPPLPPQEFLEFMAARTAERKTAAAGIRAA
jgi:sensor c-di-GMP phosphodiesterase-like protein